jgi:hypothetical protein
LKLPKGINLDFSIRNDGVRVTGIPDENIDVKSYKYAKRPGDLNYSRYKFYSTEEEKKQITASYTFSIYRNATPQVWFVTYTLEEKVDIYGQKYYPATKTTDNFIRKLHSDLQKVDCNSWWFKEFSKKGATHYHGIVDVLYPKIPLQAQQDYLTKIWHYGKQVQVVIAKDKLAAIKYVAKEGDFVAISKLI